MRRFATTLAVLLASGGLLASGDLSAFAGPTAAQRAVAPSPRSAQGATPLKPTFVRPGLSSDAVRLKGTLTRLSAGKFKGRSSEDLEREGLALALSDPRGATERLAGAIAAGADDSAAWMAFANAALAAAAAVKDDDEAKLKLEGWLLPAFYRAYEVATTPAAQAAALRGLGQRFADQEDWRPALDSDRASLAAADDPALRAVYDKLREEHGFRSTEYKVDAEAATPRVCFQFSEDLKGSRADLASYVALDGSATAAVSTEARQICVEALAHGGRYHIEIRSGLPSTVGETLLKTGDYDVFVPDRSPRVSFGGSGYVLPRVGADGIPLLSVNVDKADLKVLRVGDRDLVPVLRGDTFRKPLEGYAFRQLAGDDAVPVWSGTLDIAGTLNQEAKTGFPVREAVGALAPGVYVMQARVHRDDPAASGGDDGWSGQPATQWFVVSDIGLTTLSGQGGTTGVVRSLATALPLGGVSVKLVARNNEVLDTRVTGPDGLVTFDPGLSRGTGASRPAALVASTAAGDYDFLDLEAAPIDLSDRGDKGRPAQSGLDALVYAERGVYRSGETVFLTALLRDQAGAALSGLPVTLVVTRPDGVESRRVTLPDAGLGGHALSLPLLSGAATGTWRVAAYADPKGSPIGETTFLVEDYLPERLTLTLKAGAAIAPGQPAEVATTTRFLYGAPGSGLEITGDSTVEAAPGPYWPALAGYEAGLVDESVSPVTTELAAPVVTDRDGAAVVVVPVPAVAATHPLQARIALRVGEPGGRAVERGTTVPILPGTALIGVKKTFGNLGEGGTASFDVVTVDAAGSRSAAAGLHWRLSRTLNDFQWYETDGRWSYERVSSSQLVADGTVSTGPASPAAVSAAVRDGRYRLEVSSDNPALPPTAVTFDVGYSGEADGGSPDRLDVTLDRADYRPGDQLHASITSRFAGQATLVIGDGLAQVRREFDLAVGDNSVSVPVDARWGTGAYAIVLAHRPLDAAAKRMPGRAVGLAWFAIDAASRGLAVTLDLPPVARPRSTIEVPARISGLRPGEAAFVTVSAVDVGILNLTQYETPKPAEYFFGQRMLGTDLRDLYGALIDGLGVQDGAIRSGGDGGGLAAEKPTQAPLARYSGIVAVGPDGTATVPFDIPAFNGTVRVSAVAWSRDRVGSTETDLVLRDPVVVAASLPRFLNIGDRARARFDIDDVEGGAGPYRLQVSPRGLWFLPADALDRSVSLTPGVRVGVDVPVTAAGLGTAGLGARLTGADLDVAQDVALPIEAGAPAVYRRDLHPLAPGQTLTVSRDLVDEFIPGSGSVSLAVSPLGDIDVPALLLALDRYPVGCSEQIVSRALPLLYVDKLAPGQDIAQGQDLPARITGAVAQLLSRQTAEGSFGLWTADSQSDDTWLDSYVTDFLTRAREAGYAVPDRAMGQALDRLRNALANGIGAEADGDRALAAAYAGYVLARNGRPVMGDLRYLAGSRLDALSTPLAKAQVGAALAMLGDRARSATVFAAATGALAGEADARDYRDDYGSKLRDAAAVLALAAEAGFDDASGKAGGILAAAQRGPYPTTTQEQAWLVLAAQAADRLAAGLVLTVDGERRAGALYRTVTSRRLDDGAVTIGNAGRTPVTVVVTTSGQLPNPEPAADKGYAIERRYYRLDGHEVDPGSVKQNDRLAVVLKVTESEATRARLLLTDPLPAGFEIDNPALVADGTIPDLPGLDTKVEPTHTEFRDDRFTAAFDRHPEDSAFFSVAYIVRAVTPGHFVHPPAVVEDMYRPERFGRSVNGVVEVRSAD